MSTSSPRQTRVVPAAALLSAWQAHAWQHGVAIDSLSPLDRLTVITQRSTYEILVVAPETAKIVVRGGLFFPTFTPARLSGCSLGGSFLKLKTIHVGFCIEVAVERRVVVTSPVRTIELAPRAAGASVM